MVYCGKPSKSCHVCRQRKTRCDAKPDGCSQCARRGTRCPGYRSQVDMMFRDQSAKVKQKIELQQRRVERRASPGDSQWSTDSDYSTPNSLDSASASPPGELQLTLHDPKPSTLILLPDVEDRATSYFLARCIPKGGNPGVGIIEMLGCLSASSGYSAGLTASIKAASFTAYAHYSRDAALARKSQSCYAEALQLTNSALSSPVDALEDSTLVSICVLGMYELLSGRTERSLDAWSNHVKGASALLQLRGFTRLQTVPQRRLFGQAMHDIVANSLQRCIRIPAPLLAMLEAIIAMNGGDNSMMMLWQTMLHVNQFCCDRREGKIPSLEEGIARALQLDACFARICDNPPRGQRYESFYTEDRTIACTGRFDIYPDRWAANAWNGMRSVRVVVLEEIQEMLIADPDFSTDTLSHPRYPDLVLQTRALCLDLQEGILASVPQLLGHARQSHDEVFGDAVESLSLLNKPQLDSSTPPEPPSLNSELPPEAAMEHTIDAIRLMWPLSFAGTMLVATEPVRCYVAKTLLSISETMGIQQARFLASSVSSREVPAAWASSTTLPSDIWKLTQDQYSRQDLPIEELLAA